MTRGLQVLLCALLLVVTSTPAWAIARPENRVWKIFSESPKTAAADLDQTLEPRGESAACGYDFASGVHKYLYGEDDPINKIDPSGHDSLGEVMVAMDISVGLDALPNLTIIQAGLSAQGQGGPDITQTLKGTLQDIEMTFYSWSTAQKLAAIHQLTALPSEGKSGASGGAEFAWDIVPLKNLGYNLGNFIPNGNSGLMCGIKPWDYTVAVNGKCFYGGSVNYAQWGTMFKVIAEFYQGIGDYADGDSYSLQNAQLLEKLWKLHYFDRGETAKEASQFVAYGYNNTMPSDALPCRPSGKVCQDQKFEWVWEPNKPRQGGR